MTIFTAIGEAIAAQRTYFHTVSELNRLGDKELNDLGINRVDIYKVAAESAMQLIRINQDDCSR